MKLTLQAVWNCETEGELNPQKKDAFGQGVQLPTHIWNLVCSTRLPQELLGNRELSLEALVLWDGRFQLPLPALPPDSEPRPFRSERKQLAGWGGTGHKLNSQKCVCMGGRSATRSYMGFGTWLHSG